MRLGSRVRSPRKPDRSRGFSLVEMLVSIVIIVLLMSAVFPFLFQAQKRFQGNVVISEANQSARAALEVMSQEIGQAGYNPQFYPNKTSSTSLTTNGCTQPIGINDLTGIHPGDWLSVDTGANQELVEVFATSESATVTTPAANCANPPNGCTGTCTFPSGNWIAAKFLFDHTTTPYNIASYKMPYGGGLLYDGGGASSLLSNGRRLQFYGDINQIGEVDYVVYSVSPMSPATTVTINGTSYTLYNLYRSITRVPFPSLPTTSTYAPSCASSASGCNSPASPMVEKVLLDTATGTTGPTGSPIFGYPSTITVGVVPNQITVVGTIVITLCVAVNPQAMETGRVQWYTMATQIRPLNLAAAISVNNSNGGLYLPPNPRSLPMVNPVNYYP
jgi:prepilin-type N-terminal cleavage/methylation domain-containing protein